MAGNRRLAAAVEVGLRELPCLVERVDDDQARALGAATNVPSTPREPVLMRPERPRVDTSFEAFADALTAVASSAGLLSSGSGLTQAVAVDLVRAEASRALQLLRALRVIRGEVSPKRRAVLPRVVLQRVIEQSESERRLRGLTLTIDRDGADCPALLGDEELLVASVSSLAVAASVLFDSSSARHVAISAAARGDGAVAFVAEHEGVELPLFWRSILADDESPKTGLPGGSATMSALVMLRAARQVAEQHEGRMSVDCSEGSTSLSIVIPAAR